MDRLCLGAARARKLGVCVEDVTSANLLAYWESQGVDPTWCYYTGEELADDWQLDHMMPLSRGGGHTVDNLVPCTGSVNSSKNNRTAEEYMNEKKETAA